MPDVVPGARLDADPRAEAWLSFALLCACSPVEALLPFDYTQLATQRLDALLAWMTSGKNPTPLSSLISPAFARLFQKTNGSADWLKLPA